MSSAVAAIASSNDRSSAPGSVGSRSGTSRTAGRNRRATPSATPGEVARPERPGKRRRPWGRGGLFGRDLLVEAALGEGADGVERSIRVRAGREDLDLVSLADAEGRHGVQAPRRHGAAAGAHVGDADVGVERGGDLDEAGRRPGVQAVGVRDDQPGRARRRRIEGHRDPGGPGLTATQMGDLRRQAAACLRRHLPGARAELGGDRRGDGALDERRLAQQDLLAPVVGQHLDRHLGRQDGAPEIHQHDDAVVRPRPLDRADDEDGVGADGVIGRVEPPGGLKLDLGPAHLPCQLRRALGQLPAVRDEDEPDHDRPQARDASVPTRSNP
jgi:hypothetical protein